MRQAIDAVESFVTVIAALGTLVNRGGTKMTKTNDMHRRIFKHSLVGGSKGILIGFHPANSSPYSIPLKSTLLSPQKTLMVMMMMMMTTTTRTTMMIAVAIK